MIVVIPNGRALADDSATGNNFAPDKVAGFAKFEQDLLDNLKPAIEKHYAAATDREQRALAGLSMGGAATAAPRRRPRRRRSSRRPFVVASQAFLVVPNNGCRSESRRTARAHWSCPGSPPPPRAGGRPGSASSRATLSLSGGWLEVVCRPATSNASLMVMGTPCSGPSRFFFARARSPPRAAALSAPSRSTTTRALIGPFRRAMRCRCASVASTELRRPFRMARASRVAVSESTCFQACPPCTPRRCTRPSHTRL